MTNDIEDDDEHNDFCPCCISPLSPAALSRIHILNINAPGTFFFCSFLSWNVQWMCFSVASLYTHNGNEEEEKKTYLKFSCCYSIFGVCSYHETIQIVVVAVFFSSFAFVAFQRRRFLRSTFLFAFIMFANVFVSFCCQSCLVCSPNISTLKGQVKARC